MESEGETTEQKSLILPIDLDISDFYLNKGKC